MKTARQTAFDLLIKTEQTAGYSNLALDAALSQSELDKRDKAFVTTLYYGVLERKLTLDFIISHYSKLPLSKLTLDVLSALRLGIYQLLYLKSVPESAAVNESVLLAEYCRKKSAKGFINAVLRSFLRDGKEIHISEEDPILACSVRYSCPQWLVKQWMEDYGIQRAEQILKCSMGRPPVTVCVNTLKITAEALQKELEAESVVVTPHPRIKECLFISNSGAIEQLPAYQKGYFHVQDVASQICCMALAAQPGERIMDLCAAPGGKTFTTAIKMENKGLIQAFDLYPKRTKLIKDGAARLGITVIDALVGNAKEWKGQYAGADRVLCDVPCSGLGVIRRKPEIKYKNPEELTRLPEIQAEILQNASRYVKAGGTLLYSTCALSKRENEAVAEQFLKENPDFLPQKLPKECQYILNSDENMITLFPDQHGSDGFFIALFIRRK